MGSRQLLRGDVGQGTELGPAAGQTLGTLERGQAEVDQGGLSIGREDDVGGLDIPVENTVLVGVVQCVGDL